MNFEDIAPSEPPYQIDGRGRRDVRRETGVSIWSAAGWADELRAGGYEVAIRQNGRVIPYAELIRREDEAHERSRRFWRGA